MALNKRILILSLALCLALCLGGCAGEGSLDDPRAFRILGGSELKDLRETGLLDYIQKKSGIKIYLEESGSLAAVEKISGGQHPYDALWIPNGFYLEAFRSEIKNPPLVMEKIFMSPVTVGVRRNLAERFGWLGPEGLAREDLSWNDIREEAVRGELQLYMTHMHTSNSGALASLALPTASWARLAASFPRDFCGGYKRLHGRGIEGVRRSLLGTASALPGSWPLSSSRKFQWS